MTEIPSVPEFSRLVNTERLSAAESEVAIHANPVEREALAQRLDLVALGSLSAVLRLKRQHGGLLRLRGTLSAEVVQRCVVSLEPVPAKVEDGFEILFSAEESETGDHVVCSDDDSDPPEPLIDEVIDIGEVVAQYLSLALDPYPRAPGASADALLATPDRHDKIPQTRPNPFAVLAGIKEKR